MEDIRSILDRSHPKSLAAFKSSHEVVAQEVVNTVEMPYPLYIREAKGSRVIDVDGNEYIDLTMGYGPNILGHAPDIIVNAVKKTAERGLQYGLFNPYQERLGRLMVDAIPCADKVVFCNTGTEATMTAIRAARAYTGKTKVAVFEGSFHGDQDYVLVEFDPDSPVNHPTPLARGSGLPKETLDQIVILPYRNEAAFDLIRGQKDDLAVVLLEPVQSSNPRLDCGDFLRRLREVCRECGVLFLMDEVITGFRLAYGGAQDYFDVVPDIATYGKIPGGGLPLGAIAGPSDVMDVFGEGMGSSEKPRIFGGGTFSGNPMTMTTGHTMVSYLKDHPEVYSYLAEQGTRLADEINQFCMTEEFPVQMMNALSVFYLRFQRTPINSIRDVDDSLREAEETFYLHLLNNGVVVPGIHLAMISYAHTPEDIDQIIDAMKRSLREVRKSGLL